MNLTDTLKCARCSSAYAGRACVVCKEAQSDAGVWAFVFATMMLMGAISLAVSKLLP